ncbi:dissimilatory-type sulfite reductase subunit alpha [Acidiferrobacter thiooxydans]|uniref:Dissimilatory-type sulfite reductase subunit alpha n=1 Tax=Acidiferrobacter thiooxydans TaxID=163359 RepID=A0A368HIS1_9GAMM|nr:dissimilatory-type sulfite reductase subunit alpha [Acidiferrobacter thiooxydans]RCN59276.1 dissimilatory-type sulfite reductase subunit alpha [Acidiferrobacter thiooxydans]
MGHRRSGGCYVVCRSCLSPCVRSGNDRRKEDAEDPDARQARGGPWPSFVTGLKRLAKDESKPYAPVMKDLLGQLEHSYETRKGYWKGGTVGVIGYGGGVIPRFSEVADKFPASAEFHTLRIMPPPGMHYTTEVLRKMCDVWEEYGSGLIALHGQSGDIMFQGCTSKNVQPAFDALNDMGFDMGGAGPALRTSMSCVGHARCEHSCYDEPRAHRLVINEFLDEMHRPAMPYKFKFKFSGCPNDCTNAIQRSDMAVIGMWRDDMKVDQKEVKAFVAERGRSYVIDNVITRCPTHSLKLADDDTLKIDNRNCVRCMHCINVMTKALHPGDDRGVALLLGGKRTLKIGDLMGTVIVPFLPLKTDEDYEQLVDIGRRVMEFFADNALEHERTGEMIERIGFANFMDGVGLPIDPNMVSHPRTNPYVRMDEWDAAVAAYEEGRKGQGAHNKGGQS